MAPSKALLFVLTAALLMCVASSPAALAADASAAATTATTTVRAAKPTRPPPGPRVPVAGSGGGRPGAGVSAAALPRQPPLPVASVGVRMPPKTCSIKPCASAQRAMVTWYGFIGFYNKNYAVGARVPDGSYSYGCTPWASPCKNTWRCTVFRRVVVRPLIVTTWCGTYPRV